MNNSTVVSPASLNSANEFVAAAEEVAVRLRENVVERDRRAILPVEQLDWVRDAGLLALPVAIADPDVEVSHEVLLEVFTILSAADSAVTQILQPHTSMLDLVRRNGSPEQRDEFFAAALRGQRFGNALSERGTAHVWEYRTTISAANARPGFRLLNGTKYYATGAAQADWIGVLAIDDDGGAVLAFVPKDAAGVTVEQDWDAFGQRSTISGTVSLADVEVAQEHIVAFDADHSIPKTSGAYAQIVHTAIDLGIARGALADGIAYVRKGARPYPLSGVDRAADEQGVQQLYGQLHTQVSAADALAGVAARALDEAARDTTADSVNTARLAVAAAKAYAGEVVLRVATDLFEGAGAGAAARDLDLDRHWRNARTHTLHDPNRWKYIHIGDWLLNDTSPSPVNRLV